MLDTHIVLYAIASRLTVFIVNEPTNSTNLYCVADYVTINWVHKIFD